MVVNRGSKLGTLNVIRVGIVAVIGAGMTMATLTAPASANGQDVQDDLALAIDSVGATAAVSNSDVELPDDGDDAAVFETDGKELTMTADSASGAAVDSADGSQTFKSSTPDTSLTLQSTSEGLRALVHIDSPAAPERYLFNMGGDVDSLQLTPDGGVVALDANGMPIAVAPAPWAVDANGVDVPTHFEISGTDLYQVINHHGGNYAYGITADPWWNPFSWPWGKWVKKSKKSVVKALKKCGKGALVGTIGLGVGTGTTNIMIKKFSKSKVAKLKVAGWQGYVGAAAAGCIINQL